MKSLVPWKWGAIKQPVTRANEYPRLSSLREEMDSLFEHYLGGMSPFQPMHFFEEELSAFTPKIDMKESEKAVIVVAEMPGMHEEEIEITLSEENLILRGEKKEEKESNLKGFYRMERCFGAFQRVVPLPCKIDAAKVEAFFKNGVVKIVLPKVLQMSEEKKIAVKPMPE